MVDPSAAEGWQKNNTKNLTGQEKKLIEQKGQKNSPNKNKINEEVGRRNPTGFVFRFESHAEKSDPDVIRTDHQKEESLMRPPSPSDTKRLRPRDGILRTMSSLIMPA
jgi:hypothetical protein